MNRLDQPIDLLLTRFPQFRAGYEDLISWRREPGAHLVFSSLFVPYLTLLLESAALSGTELSNAFSFVEELARSQTPGVRDVIVQSVLDFLVEEPRWIRSGWPFMGETTRRYVQAIAKASS